MENGNQVDKGNNQDPDQNLELQEKNEKGGEQEKQQPQPVPYERFKEVNDKMRDMEQKLQELSESKTLMEQEQERKRQQELKEQQKFEQLAQEFQGQYEELKPKYEQATQRIEALEGVLESLSQAQMEQVPELYRTVVASMPLLERISWLAENQSKLSESKPQGIPGTPEGKGKPELSREERLKRARRTF